MFHNKTEADIHAHLVQNPGHCYVDYFRQNLYVLVEGETMHVIPGDFTGMDYRDVQSFIVNYFMSVLH